MPGWLLAGLGLGGICTVIVAATFVVGTRAFPDPIARAAGPYASGESRRRAEIRDYLRSIDEPFVENREVADRVVAFFLPDRDVAITFDAMDYFRIERAGYYAILVEHELPGAGIGARLPFEAPTVEPAPAGAGADAFAALDLPPTASAEEVRAAYRERVKTVHPDHGGDPDAFRALRDAYVAAKRRAE